MDLRVVMHGVTEVVGELSQEASGDEGGGSGIDAGFALCGVVMSSRFGGLEVDGSYLAARKPDGYHAELVSLRQELGSDCWWRSHLNLRCERL